MVHNQPRNVPPSRPCTKVLDRACHRPEDVLTHVGRVRFLQARGDTSGRSGPYRLTNRCHAFWSLALMRTNKLSEVCDRLSF